jgi:hypothetical protein
MSSQTRNRYLHWFSLLLLFCFLVLSLCKYWNSPEQIEINKLGFPPEFKNRYFILFVMAFGLIFYFGIGYFIKKGRYTYENSLVQSDKSFLQPNIRTLSILRIYVLLILNIFVMLLYGMDMSWLRVIMVLVFVIFNIYVIYSILKSTK